MAAPGFARACFRIAGGGPHDRPRRSNRAALIFFEITRNVEKGDLMNAIRHIATCTRNNRRIARFYRLIFGMEELWNERQNSPYSFYLTDGFVNMNCLLLHPGLKRDPGIGIEHFGIFVDNIEESEKKITAFEPDTKIEGSPRDGRYEDKRFNDPEGNRLEIATNPWG